MDFRKIKRGYNYLKQNGIKKSIEKLKLRYNIKKNMKNISFDYSDYIKNNALTKEDIETQIKTKFEIMPKVSIVIPMYNTKFEFFRELIESIISQTYSNF